MIEVETPDGIAEFPDGTDHATIKSVLAKRYGKPSAEETVRQSNEEFNRDYWAGVKRGAKEPLYALGQIINRIAGTPESQRAFDVRMREALPPIAEPTEGQKTGQFMGGMVATAPAMAVPGLGAARLAPRLAAGAVGGGAVAALSPEADTTSPEFTEAKATKAGLGAVLGAGFQGAAAGIGRLVSPVRASLNPEQQRLAGVFEDQIGPLTAGQATGSRPLKTAESVLENLPGSSTRQLGIRQGQNEGFTKAVLAKAGIKEDAATPDVLRKARDAFGREYDALAQNSQTTLDIQFARDLQRVAQSYHKSLKADQARVLDNKILELTGMAQPKGGQLTVLDGEMFQRIRSPLVKQIADNAVSDPPLARALKGIKDALDTAEVRSLPPSMKPLRADLDKRYAIFKTIEGAVEKETAGQISPIQLFNAAAKRGKGGAWAEGKGELNDLARAGREFLKPLPDSFTSQRAAITNLITMGGMGGMGGGAGAMFSGGDPAAAGAGMAMGLLGPIGAQRALGNPAVQAWLRQQYGAAIPGLLGRVAPMSGLLAR